MHSGTTARTQQTHSAALTATPASSSRLPLPLLLPLLQTMSHDKLG